MGRFRDKLQRRIDDWKHYSGLGGFLKSEYSRYLRRYRRAPLPARGRIVAVTHDRMPGRLFARLGTSDFPVLKDLLCGAEYDAAIDLAAARAGGPDRVRLVLDLGANIGIAARLLRREYPAATIISVEPDQENFRVLDRNVSEAPAAASIRPVRACAVGHSRRVGLDRSGDAWAFTMTEAAQGGESLPGLTIPELLTEAGQPATARIDLLKCDIEGAERELFEHCAPWIGQVGVMVVELHTPYTFEQFAGHVRAGAGPSLTPRFETIRKDGAIHVVLVELSAAASSPTSTKPPDPIGR